MGRTVKPKRHGGNATPSCGGVQTPAPGLQPGVSDVNSLALRSLVSHRPVEQRDQLLPTGPHVKIWDAREEGGKCVNGSSDGDRHPTYIEGSEVAFLLTPTQHCFQGSQNPLFCGSSIMELSIHCAIVERDFHERHHPHAVCSNVLRVLEMMPHHGHTPVDGRHCPEFAREDRSTSHHCYGRP